jgi:pimeloyl-ACP methyl ester carboxylesterase
MRTLPLLVLALLLAGCTAVHVRDERADDYFAMRRSDILTSGHLSASSRETLLVLGLDGRACEKHPRPCLSRLTDATAVDDEQRLATIAELHLSLARVHQEDSTDHYLQAARFSYAYLFFTARDAGERAFEDRQTQVRDFYSFATERLTTLLFAGAQHPCIHIGNVRVQLPRGQVVPKELIPASRLAFDGIRNTYRRDGFGAAFVAVAAAPERADAPVTLNEPRFVAATVVLRFPGATLDEVLQGPDAMLDVYDPYRDETVDLGGRTVPLTANFTAPYALWLARSQFGREAGRALFSNAAALSQPRIYAMQPYDPQRRTIVMIHGLASSPEGWVNLVNEIMGEETLRRRYQVWQVFYPTNLPIPENVRNIRAALQSALHPDDRVTLVGHSMGGVISRLLVVDSPNGLWQTFFDRPVDAAQRERLFVLEPYLTLSPLPRVDQAIFLASPHRGSPMAHAWIGRFASRLVHLPSSALQTIGALADAISGELPLQAEVLRHRGFSSVAYLSDEDRYLRATSELPIAAGVTYHSIIGSNDGVVPYSSSHLDGAASEHIVTSGHSVQKTVAAILVVRGILRREEEEKE